MHQHRHTREGTSTIIRAPQRGGKTLTMSLFALSHHQKGRRIFTNLAYSFPYTPLYFKELDLNDTEVVESIRGSAVTLDEFWMIMDSRASATSDSRKLSRWLYQSKKMGIDFYGTTHEVHMLDRRSRENYDYLIDAQVLPRNRPEDQPPSALYLQIQNGPLQRQFSRRVTIELTPAMLSLYDTENVFDPLAEPEDYTPPRHSVAKNGYKKSAPYEYVPRPRTTIPEDEAPFDF